jgi:hypothetical protein
MEYLKSYLGVEKEVFIIICLPFSLRIEHGCLHALPGKRVVYRHDRLQYKKDDDAISVRKETISHTHATISFVASVAVVYSTV